MKKGGRRREPAAFFCGQGCFWGHCGGSGGSCGVSMRGWGVPCGGGIALVCGLGCLAVGARGAGVCLVAREKSAVGLYELAIDRLPPWKMGRRLNRTLIQALFWSGWTIMHKLKRVAPIRHHDAVWGPQPQKSRLWSNAGRIFLIFNENSRQEKNDMGAQGRKIAVMIQQTI